MGLGPPIFCFMVTQLMKYVSRNTREEKTRSAQRWPRRSAVSAALLIACVVAVGCNSQQADLAQRLRKLDAENVRLTRRVNQTNQRVAALEKQLQTLQGFPPERMAHFVTAAQAKIGRFTGPFDSDNDGIDDGIKVYLKLRDRHGDTIKAGGQVDIEFWDLAASQDQRLLGTWQFAMANLSAHWLAGMMADHYRFELTWPGGRPPRNLYITVKLRFADAITGAVFESQKAVEVAIAGEK